jgi:hypothetical protein
MTDYFAQKRKLCVGPGGAYLHPLPRTDLRRKLRPLNLTQLLRYRILFGVSDGLHEGIRILRNTCICRKIYLSELRAPLPPFRAIWMALWTSIEDYKNTGAK